MAKFFGDELFDPNSFSPAGASNHAHDESDFLRYAQFPTNFAAEMNRPIETEVMIRGLGVTVDSLLNRDLNSAMDPQLQRVITHSVVRLNCMRASFVKSERSYQWDRLRSRVGNFVFRFLFPVDYSFRAPDEPKVAVSGGFFRPVFGVLERSIGTIQAEDDREAAFNLIVQNGVFAGAISAGLSSIYGAYDNERAGALYDQFVGELRNRMFPTLSWDEDVYGTSV